MQDTLQRYLDSNRMYNFDGHRGVSHVEKITREVCGYDSMTAFLEDNPGAVEAVVEWIGQQRNTDWKDNLESMVGPEEEEEVGDLVPAEEIAVSATWVEP